MLLRIGEVAERAGLSHDTLRYYEGVGLVEPAGRSPVGHRLYDEKVLDQLAVVTALRSVGFSIAQVLDVLAVKDGTVTVRARIDAMRAALDRLDQSLDEKEAALRRAESGLSPDTRPARGTAAGKPAQSLPRVRVPVRGASESPVPCVGTAN